MKIKHVSPELTYVALVCFTARAWASGKEDSYIDMMESFVDESWGWEYEDYNGPAAELKSDYAFAFNSNKDRLNFIKNMKADLEKHVKLVTTLNVTMG